MSSPQRVELSLPAQPEMLFLARMTAAAVASRAEFGFDQVEDLRLAIDELCITLAGEDGSDGRVNLAFEWSADDIEVVGTFIPESSQGVGVAKRGQKLIPAPTLNELSERILDALVDEHGTDNTGGSARAWFRVRRRNQPNQ
jgi:anti-sigma regulatory factor (Ser/Thr protein kinase)